MDEHEKPPVVNPIYRNRTPFPPKKGFRLAVSLTVVWYFLALLFIGLLSFVLVKACDDFQRDPTVQTTGRKLNAKFNRWLDK